MTRGLSTFRAASCLAGPRSNPASCLAGPRSNPASRRERAQATVEFALILPLVVVVFVLGLDGVLIARDELLVVHSAREGARVAAVTGDLAQAASAAKSRGAPADAAVSLVSIGGGSNELVTVTVRWSLTNRVLLLGPVGNSLSVSHSVTMRRETRPIV